VTKGMARPPFFVFFGSALILLACLLLVPGARSAEKSLLKELFSSDREADKGRAETDPHDIPFKTWFPTEKPGSADEADGDKLGPAPVILPALPVDAEHTIKPGDTLKAILTKTCVPLHEAQLAIRAL